MRRVFKVAAIVSLMSLVGGGLCLAQGSPEAEAKKTDIKKLLEATTPPDLANSMLAPMLKNMRAMIPGSDKDFDEFSKEFIKEFAGDKFQQAIFEAVYPVYDKSFTDDEIKGMLKFYSSELGRKMVRTTPEIQQASMIVGMKFGQAAAQKAMMAVQMKKAAAGSGSAPAK